MKKKDYIDSNELESHWAKWENTKDKQSWDFLLTSIYKICDGVAVHFKPPTKDDHSELTHEAFTQIVQKIIDGKLTFEPGRAPVFNLLTTTAFRQLYSKMKKDSRRREILNKFRKTKLHSGELLHTD